MNWPVGDGEDFQVRRYHCIPYVLCLSASLPCSLSTNLIHSYCLYGLSTTSLQGVYDRTDKEVHLFQRGNRKKKVHATVLSLHHPDLPALIGTPLFFLCCNLILVTHYNAYTAVGKGLLEQLREDIEVLDSLVPEPDLQQIQVQYSTVCTVHDTIYMSG